MHGGFGASVVSGTPGGAWIRGWSLLRTHPHPQGTRTTHICRGGCWLGSRPSQGPSPAAWRGAGFSPQPGLPQTAGAKSQSVETYHWGGFRVPACCPDRWWWSWAEGALGWGWELSPNPSGGTGLTQAPSTAGLGHQGQQRTTSLPTALRALREQPENAEEQAEPWEVAVMLLVT